MVEPDRPAPSNVIHNIKISGGQQAIASNNVTFEQHNNGTSEFADRFDAYLRTLKEQVAHFEDPDRADREVAAIEAARAQQQPDRQPVLASLATLATLTTVGSTLANAVNGATDLVSRSWPF